MDGCRDGRKEMKRRRGRADKSRKERRSKMMNSREGGRRCR